MFRNTGNGLAKKKKKKIVHIFTYSKWLWTLHSLQSSKRVKKQQ